jgi:hypothetical protein
MTYSIYDGSENWRHRKGFILLIDRYANSTGNRPHTSKGNQGIVSIRNKGKFHRRSR